MGLSASVGREPWRRELKTIIRNARVLTMDAQDTEYARATVHVENGMISVVDPNGGAGNEAAGDGGAVDAAGHLLMPGLVNAHFHSSANHLKGSFDSLPLEIFMLYESPPQASAVEPRAAYLRPMLGALEMLKSGVTAVLDDAFFVPAPSPELIDAVMQAYEDCGIRAVLALDQPNVPELAKF